MNLRTILFPVACSLAACGGEDPALLQSADGKYRVVHVAEAADASSARAAMVQALAQHTKIDVVFAHDDALAAAAAAACAEKGRTEVRFVDIQALRLPVAAAAIDMALLACNGLAPHRELLVGTRVATLANAAAGGEVVPAPGDVVLELLRRQHAEVLTTEPKTDNIFRIGLVFADSSDAGHARWRDALTAAARRYPQIAFDCRPTVQEFVAQGFHAILVVPTGTDSLASACKAAMAQSIKVIVVDRAPGSDDFTCFVATQDDAIGDAAARQIAELLGPAGGTIVELQGPAASSQARARHAGFVKRLGLQQKP